MTDLSPEARRILAQARIGQTRAPELLRARVKDNVSRALTAAADGGVRGADAEVGALLRGSKIPAWALPSVGALAVLGGLAIIATQPPAASKPASNTLQSPTALTHSEKMNAPRTPAAPGEQTSSAEGIMKGVAARQVEQPRNAEDILRGDSARPVGQTGNAEGVVSGVPARQVEQTGNVDEEIMNGVSAASGDETNHARMIKKGVPSGDETNNAGEIVKGVSAASGDNSGKARMIKQGVPAASGDETNHARAIMKDVSDASRDRAGNAGVTARGVASGNNTGSDGAFVNGGVAERLESTDNVESLYAPRSAVGRSRDSVAQGIDDLRAEMQLLSRAEAALRSDDPQAALQVLRTHASRFRRGQLRDEREGLRLIALCALGRDAKTALAGYLEKKGDAVLHARVLEACSGRTR